uniref:Uncharacterized protein n=1 Tax=Rhizophora mucronata TaxID=61149 RepID=A0A2P2NQ18_RHIMU
MDSLTCLLLESYQMCLDLCSRPQLNFSFVVDFLNALCFYVPILVKGILSILFLPF